MNTTPIRKILFVLAHGGRKIVAHPGEATLSVRMALWVVLISMLVRLTTLARAQKIASFKIRSSPVEHKSETPANLAQMIDSLLGIDLFIFRRSCWKRALVLHRYLALNGIESQISFGLRKESNGRMDGHAWLEHNGQPLLEDNAAKYVVTFSLPAEHSSSGQSVSYQS